MQDPENSKIAVQNNAQRIFRHMRGFTHVCISYPIDARNSMFCNLYNKRSYLFGLNKDNCYNKDTETELTAEIRPFIPGRPGEG